MTVPVDWSRPDGATIQIAVTRRKATDPTARLGTVVWNPGGPADGGLRHLKQGPVMSPEVHRRFDVVGFDPRGTGDSHPVRCDGSLKTWPVVKIPRSAAEFDTLKEHNRVYGLSCRRLTGPVFDFLDTASVARDMDAIRAALGQPRISFYGRSYGTLLGQMYAELRPQRMRAMVLDSVMDHSIRSTLRFLRPGSVASETSFRMFVAWCARTTTCSLHGSDVDKVFTDLLAAGSRGELFMPGIGPIGPDLLSSLASAQAPEEWPITADRLAMLAAQLGTPSDDMPTGAPSDSTPVADPRAAIFCQDWSLPFHGFAELDRYRRLLEKSASPTVKIGATGWMWALSCLGWPAPVRNPQHRFTVASPAPILLVNSRWDTATAHEWARNVARQSGATLLTYEGLSHSVYLRGGPCVQDVVDRHLITGKTPPRHHITCPNAVSTTPQP